MSEGATHRVPKITSELDKLKDEVRRDVIRANARYSEITRVPLDPEYLEKRAEFETRWNAIVKEGDENGYLVWNCEGDREIDTSVERDGPREFTETVMQYDKRIDALVDSRVGAIIHNASRRHY